MPWFLTLHIAALLCWCGALLYLPSLIASRDNLASAARQRTARQLFTLAATPAALVTIISGTALYLIGYSQVAWLVMKLTLVSGLVVCHVLTGQLIFYVANKPQGTRGAAFVMLLAVISALLIIGTLWLVLAKPY